MAYNQPVSARILLRSRVAQAATHATLSTVSFDQVDIGSAYLSSGSPPTIFTSPYAGNLDVHMIGWCCGAGTGQIQVTSTRSAVIQYNQKQNASTGCFNSGCHFIIPNVQVGDQVTIQMDMNTTGTIVTSITSVAGTYDQGTCTIYFYPSN